jgi:energy-coupling factor transporter ATP-binding protein EcfA2
MEPAIELNNVSFTYLHSDEPVLKNVNLSIPQNKVTALVGPVGAGKSTLILTLNRIIPSYIPGVLTGEIKVLSEDISNHEIEELAEKLNLLFDDPVLQVVGLTVEEDVAFGPANLGLPREEIWERVKQSLAQLRLQGYEKRNPRTLSGGEMQLLAMAATFAMRPQILVMDEPVAMLDPLGKAMVFQAIKDLIKKRGLTTVVTDSGADIEAVCEIADHMVLLDKGTVIDQGSPEEILAKRPLVEETTLRVPQVTRTFWDLKPKQKTVPVRLLEAVQAMESISKKQLIKTNPGFKPSNHKAKRGEEIVIAKNIHHTYPVVPPVKALRGVDITIHRGEIVALLGQNGSGKTTLALHLVGILKPTNEDATIEVAGLDVIKATTRETIQHINYVFQNPYNQLFSQTFGEEVEYGPKQLGLPPEVVEERVVAALDAVGLLQWRNFYQASLTRSEATLLGLASVLSLDPEVIIADEPTKGLDEPAADKVIQVLQEKCKANKAVIMITHDMELAAKYSDRVMVMSKGKVLANGTPREIFANKEVLEEAYLAPPQITRLALELGLVEKDKIPLTIEEFFKSTTLSI